VSRSDQYRARADEYERDAAHAVAEEVRRELMQLAVALRALADRLDGQKS
jgi:hypothetical protein